LICEFGDDLFARLKLLAPIRLVRIAVNGTYAGCIFDLLLCHDSKPDAIQHRPDSLNFVTRVLQTAALGWEAPSLPPLNPERVNAVERFRQGRLLGRSLSIAISARAQSNARALAILCATAVGADLSA
jgi:hypothetical protein